MNKRSLEAGRAENGQNIPKRVYDITAQIIDTCRKRQQEEGFDPKGATAEELIKIVAQTQEILDMKQSQWTEDTVQELSRLHSDAQKNWSRIKTKWSDYGFSN